MTKEEIINMMRLTHKRLSNELESINERHVILVNLIAEYEHLIRCASDNDLDSVLKEYKDNA